MVVLVFMQFFLVFLILLFLASTLFQQHQQSQLLHNGIGEDFWMIESNLKNKEKYPLTSEAPLPWQSQQFAFLEEKFPGKVGFSYADFNTVPLNNNQVIVLRLSENLFEKLKKALIKEDASYFYTNIYNHSLNEVNSGENVIKLDKQFLVEEDIPLLFSPKIRNSNTSFFDYVILPAKQIPFNENLTVINGFLIDVESQDFNELNIAKELEMYNPEFLYTAKRSIKEKDEKILQTQMVGKIAIVFTSLTLCIILSSMIGFVLVQFHREKTKLAIFKTFGAVNKDLFKLYMLWNTNLIVPPFLVAVLIFSLISVLIINSTGVVFAIFINLLILILLLLISIIPLVRLNSKSNLIDEIGGSLWESSN